MIKKKYSKKLIQKILALHSWNCGEVAKCLSLKSPLKSFSLCISLPNLHPGKVCVKSFFDFFPLFGVIKITPRWAPFLHTRSQRKRVN